METSGPAGPGLSVVAWRGRERPDWLMLLRAPGLALRPSRLLLGVVGWGLVAWVAGRAVTPDALGSWLGRGVFGGWSPGGGSGGAAWVWAAAAVSLAVWMVGSVAVGRSAVLELCRGRRVGFSEPGRFVGRHALSMVAGVLSPGIPLALAWLVLRGLGLLAGVPVLDVAAIGLGLGLSLLAGLVACVAVAALPLFAGAIVCEDTAANDAMQRSWSILCDRPARVLAYALGLLLCGVVSVGAYGVVVGTGVWLAGSTVLSSADGWAARWWVWVAGLLVPGYALSVAWCGLPLVYLLGRRAADGSDAWRVADRSVDDGVSGVVVGDGDVSEGTG